MIAAILYTWFIMTLAVIVIFSFIMTQTDEKMTRDNCLMGGLCMVFSPLALLAILCVMWHESLKRKWRMKAGAIHRKWENEARNWLFQSSASLPWDWNKNARRWEAMRTVVRQMSDEDLQYLYSTGKEVYEMDKDTQDCLVDEVLERKIINA